MTVIVAIVPSGASAIVGEHDFTTFAAESVAKDPKALLLALSDRVAEEVSRRRQRCLQKVLKLACRCLDAGRTRLAIVKLRVFQWKVKLLVCFRRIPRATGRELISDAREIIACLRESLPRRHHVRG